MPGKSRKHKRKGKAHQSASMRPRQYAGEIFGMNIYYSSNSFSFNEAPAICRGNPTRVRSRDGGRQSFNEAPAICRGNPDLFSKKEKDIINASMRPRQYAGEIHLMMWKSPLGLYASMRPRQYAGEIPAPSMRIAYPARRLQ